MAGKKAAALKGGDKCPSCKRGTLEPALVPTDEQFAKAYDRENPIGLPDAYDTANPAQRAELGALFLCDRCDYRHREAPADAEAK